MRYAAKMIVEKRSGQVRLVAVGRAPESAMSYRKYLSPGVSEVLQVFPTKKSAGEALELLTQAEAWRLESRETRLKAAQDAVDRVTRLRIPVTTLSGLIGEKRLSIDAYIHGWSPVPPRIVAKLTIAADKLEQLADYLGAILPKEKIVGRRSVK